MSIILGADPRWYGDQEDRTSDAVRNVSLALAAYEKRKREKAAGMLEFFDQNPGSAAGGFGHLFMEKYGHDPEMAAAFSEAQRRDSIRQRFFEDADKAQTAYNTDVANTRQAGDVSKYAGMNSLGMGALGLSGAMDSINSLASQGHDEGVIRSMDEDPTGFRQAFSAAPPIDRMYLAQQMQKVNMPLTRLIPDATPDPLLALAQTGEIPVSSLVGAQKAKLGLQPSEAWNEQRILTNEDQTADRAARLDDLKKAEDYRFEHQKTLADRRASRSGAGAGKDDQGRTHKQRIDDYANETLANLPPAPQPAAVGSRQYDADWKAKGDVQRESDRTKARSAAQAEDRIIRKFGTKAINPGDTGRMVARFMAEDPKLTREAAWQKAMARLNRLESTGRLDESSGPGASLPYTGGAPMGTFYGSGG